ncbi:MAG: helix-turn-helix transcriptional regulator [Candidatus Polarisedimenticolaceae bacterium]|nr:helix-turn-helix transcriptional regulator [Candidatus Polarisedimenticolaceae bacterium]
MRKLINQSTLQSALKTKGWTQSQLADEVGVSAQSVTNWLKGKGFPRPSTLLKLATLLRLSFEQLVETDDTNRPVVAFRKKGNAKTTDSHITKATEIGMLLKPLVAYLAEMRALRTLITSPSTEYNKLQLAVSQTRERLGLGDQAVLRYEQLISEFKECGAILIPVLWGAKGKHENAMHIRLPAEDVTFIFVNLDTRVEDFKFWMAHELAHVFTPDLTGSNEGEDYADAFAGSLLFPRACAEAAYADASRKRSAHGEIDALLHHAHTHAISLNTVYQRVKEYAKFARLPSLRVDDRAIHMVRNSSPGPLVSEALFDPMPPNAKHYIAASENIFHSTFFQAIKQMILDKGIEPGYLQQVLNLSIGDAQALHEELAH